MKNSYLTLSTGLFLFALCLFFSCSKYQDTSNTPYDPIPPEVTVIAGMQGRVLDEKGLPVQGAIVTSGTATTSTDINGLFNFSNIKLSSRFGYVRVTKDGYFAGSRSIITNGGAQNYVSIQLIPRTAKTSFSASSGGSVVVQTGDTAVFTGSSIVNAATKTTYTGTVHVYATYLDPTDPALPKYMPGDLRGIGSDGKETALQSFGMMTVELEGDAGEKLQIGSGQKATLTMAIPAALQGTAPATIPLWYFNDSTGRWIQEGTAVRQGNSYVGQVGHFTYWNCDAPIGTVLFKVRVKDQYGNPLAYTYIQFQSPVLGTRGGYTDSSGLAQGLIPKGQALMMQVVSECGNVLAGVNVGPALTDQDLGTVTATVSFTELTLSGTVVDCNTNPVDSGFVNVFVDGLDYRAAVKKGAFTLPINRCFSGSTSIQLIGGDYATGLQSQATVITADGGLVNAGQLTACGTVAGQSINFTLGSNSYSILAPPDNITYSFSSYSNESIIVGTNASQQRIEFSLPRLTSTGLTSLDSVYVDGIGNSFYQGAGLNCTITTLGPVDSYVEGNFAGQMYMVGAGSPTTISGTFRVKRTN